MKKLFLTIILIPLISIAQVDDVKVEATVEAREAMIGDQIYYELKAERPKHINIIFPTLNDTIGPFTIANTFANDTIVEENKEIIKKKYFITVFDSGDYRIPALSFAYTDSSDLDNFRFKKTNPISIRFNTVEIDSTAGFKDIKTNMEAEFSIYEILDYLLYSLLAIVIILLTIYIYKKYFKKEEVEEDIQKYDPKIPAHILATESLKSLQEKKLWQQNQIKLYHTELTHIIRLYIERVYGIMAVESTTDEILFEFNKKNSNIELYDSLKYMLNMADLTKFAKQQPLPEENIKSIEKAFEFVNIAKNIFEEIEKEDENGGN